MLRRSDYSNAAPDMMRSRFEELVGQHMGQLEKSVMDISPIADAGRIAMIQGVHKGLRLSLELYRQAARDDVDPEEADR